MKCVLRILCKPVLVLSLVITTANLLIASSGAIQGKVSDSNSGEGLSFANVTIKIAGVVTGAQTDFDGYYSIKPIPTGTYNLEVNYIGYASQITNGVLVVADKITFLDIQMGAESEVLDELVIVEYGTLFIKKCKSATDNIVTKEDIDNLPTRNVNSIASTSVGVYQSDEVSSTTIKGCRSDVTDYFIDGIRVRGKTTKEVELEKAATQQQIKAGQLTAGEIHDFSKWELWNDLTKNELSEYKDVWAIYPEQRYVVQAVTEDGFPIVNATVSLNVDSKTIWFAKTDNTGKAELWNVLFKNSSQTKKRKSDIKASINYEGVENKITQLKHFKDGINIITLKQDCNYFKNLDIAFVVDATGSMDDEIDFLKVELLDVINRVQTEFEALNIRLGNIFYRDKAEEYLTKSSPLTKNIKEGIAFIKDQKADGGGDFPEAVDAGLDEAVNQLQWSEKAVARILFLVLDAPPHKNEAVNKKLQSIIIKAAQKGIRIVPIVGSGIDKSTEYLLRSIALATNGHYLFLTDHSGIGGTHLKPSTHSYEVKKLNDLLVDIITKYVQTPNCNGKDEPIKVDQKLKDSVKIFPNPNNGLFTIKSNEDLKEIFITDINGKILIRYKNFAASKNQVDIANFPTGIYFVRYELDGKVLSKKVVKR